MSMQLHVFKLPTTLTGHIIKYKSVMSIRPFRLFALYLLKPTDVWRRLFEFLHMWDMTIAHRGLKFIIISRGQRLGLEWQCSRSDVEPRSRAVFSSLMPNSHRPPDTTRQCSLCRVRWCELSRSDRLTGAFCVAVRPAVAPVVEGR